MNILIYDLFGSFQIKDVEYCLKKLGHKCKVSFYLAQDRYHDKKLSELVQNDLCQNDIDLIFTTNYYPVVSSVCYKNNIPYFAWVYDSPADLPSTETMDYPTNRIFFFSKYEYQHYKNACGLDTVYYLPLAANIERLSAITPDYSRFSSDISLVGGLYFSDTFYSLRSIMSPEQQKFIDAVVAVQMGKSGSFVIDSALTDGFISQVNAYYRTQSESAIQPTREQFFFSICAHLTHLDRLLLLNMCGDRQYETKLYIADINNQDNQLLLSHNVSVNAPVSYHEDMPQVFKCSKINLNPTTRANRTGIPLRVVDVLGCGGFLITNHQPEMDDYFFEDEIITYETSQEAVEKIDYYLCHEEERLKIARKGFERVSKDFNFLTRVQKMLTLL